MGIYRCERPVSDLNNNTKTETQIIIVSRNSPNKSNQMLRNWEWMVLIQLDAGFSSVFSEKNTHTHTLIPFCLTFFFAGGYQFFVFVYFLLFSLKLKKWCISLFCSLIEKNTHDFFAHHLDFWVFSEIMMVFHELIKSLKVSCCFVCFPLVVNFFSVFLIKCEFLTCFGAAMTKFVLFFWPMKKLPFSLIGSSFWKISWSGASAYASV